MARTANDRSEFLAAVAKVLGTTVTQLDRKDIQRVVDTENLAWPHWLTSSAQHRAGRGLYSLIAMAPGSAATQSKSQIMMARGAKKIPVFRPNIPTVSTSPVAENAAPPAVIDSAQLGTEASETLEHQSLVPFKARGYVPFGHYNTLQAIISSGIFYPAFVTGLSGNGKTMMLEQICANLDREFIRANITAETDEDDLLGGFRLQDGKTVWQNGPVVVAMERGAILLLDEVDLGTNKLMCLQPVLEGKPIYLKKINRIVRPNKGFNVVATANTKGQGNMDGKFAGTNVLNEAFLERFPITIEQEYPSEKTEEKILINQLGIALEERGVTLDEFHTDKAMDFVSKLISWSAGIRKLHFEGGTEEIISTRRLVHIINAFVILDFNRRMAVDLCLSRFDTDTKTEFMDLLSKLDTELDGIKYPETPEQRAAKEADAAKARAAEEAIKDAGVSSVSNDILQKMKAAVAAQAQAQSLSKTPASAATPLNPTVPPMPASAPAAAQGTSTVPEWGKKLEKIAQGQDSKFLSDLSNELQKMIAEKEKA